MKAISINDQESELINLIIKKYRDDKENSTLLKKVLSRQALSKKEWEKVEDCLRHYRSNTMFIYFEKLENGVTIYNACEDLIKKVITLWQSFYNYT